MRRTRAAVVLLLLASLTGCPRRVAPPTEALELAAKAADAGSTSSRTLAFAGHHALLIQGDAKKAQTLFDLALKDSPAEAWALYGQVLLAQRAGKPEVALTAALDLCLNAPRHPLAAAAARLALDVGGQATSLDDTLVNRVPSLFERGPTGDAAFLLRSALANAYADRGDAKRQDAVLTDMGVVREWALVGPFSPWHVLDMARPTAPEQSGELEHVGAGPFGPLAPRAIAFPDGRFSLTGEPPQGDVYVVAADVEVAERGVYVVRTITSMDHVLLLDGTTVAERLTVGRPAPTLTTRAVFLEPGKHRLMVRAARERAVGYLTTALSRLDGKPAGVTFHAAKGPAARWSGVELKALPPGLYAGAASLHEALIDEAGDALARVVAVQDALSRDRDGARRVLSALPEELKGPTVAVLRARMDLNDGALPRKVARGRATRELEAALAKDKNDVDALMLSAQLALEDERALDALTTVKTARAAITPPGAPVLELQARIELQLGLDAQARATAAEAVAALPGHCDALELEYDIARRRDAIADADTLLGALDHCPNSAWRAAQHWRTRGDVDRAVKRMGALLERDENQMPVATTVASLYVTQRRLAEATTLLEQLLARWPRNAILLKQLADVHEQAGREQEALAAREQALRLDGSDLSLRRLVHRRKTGKELLDEYAISTQEALKAYEAAPGNEEATSAFILDAAAVKGYPDGSSVDRIHVIQKALDQQGVQDIAEVDLPQGAQVLKLRTLKADGTVLEPESLGGKDGVSLPGVQVGDMVEYEFLMAHGARGPGQPGFTAATFYFQVARQPNNWSTYTVVAPKGSGLQVDAHNMKATQPRTVGDQEVFFHEERRVPPYIPEPMGPPSGNEWLPFVAVGTGQHGNDGVLHAYADLFLDRGLVTFEVEQFAKRAAGDKQGLEALRAVYAAVMEKLSGADAGLGMSASASVAQDRGSRTWLLKAAAQAVGFDARLAAVRTFSADPAPYVFPNEALLPYVCVRVEVPGQEAVWLDPLVRYAPFGELPEFAMGGRDAFLLPEPGKPLARVQTPPLPARPAKETTLDLKLAADGVLTGVGEERYSGFEAAQLAEALEAVAPDQRDQALQGALSRYFGGADLSKLEVKSSRGVGATVTVRYEFTAPRFGRLEGDKRMVLGALTFPLMLGRRFLMMGSRQTPLFIEGSENTRTVATVTLPKGWVLPSPLGEVKRERQWGSFVRREVQTGEVLNIEEVFHLAPSRIPPDKYDDFAQFAGDLDLLQGRDLLLERR